VLPIARQVRAFRKSSIAESSIPTDMGYRGNSPEILNRSTWRGILAAVFPKSPNDHDRSRISDQNSIGQIGVNPDSDQGQQVNPEPNIFKALSYAFMALLLNGCGL